MSCAASSAWGSAEIKLRVDKMSYALFCRLTNKKRWYEGQAGINVVRGK